MNGAGKPAVLPAPAEVPVRDVDWPRAVRIVSSRYPPVGLFDRVASSDELDAVFSLEAMTNERLRAEAGDISLVPPGERLLGEGTTPVMASFTHPAPTRFSDGSYGVYYCSFEARTAIRETVYHRELFLAHGGFAPMDLEMREYLAPVAAPLHDLRGEAGRWPAVYDPGDYSASQAFGGALRAEDSWGIVYDSVRDSDGGWCAGLFRPRAVAGPCIQGRHLIYRWDGRCIRHIFEVAELAR